MAKVITVRFTQEQATALADHKARTLVPTEAFIRRAVDEALKKAEQK